MSAVIVTRTMIILVELNGNIVSINLVRKYLQIDP